MADTGQLLFGFQYDSELERSRCWQGGAEAGGNGGAVIAASCQLPVSSFQFPASGCRLSGRKPKAESRKPKAESRKPKAESRKPKADRRHTCPSHAAGS